VSACRAVSVASVPTARFSRPRALAGVMTWGDLFERGTDYEVTNEAVRAALRERRAESGEEP
jgi:hypothetical protein